MINLISLIPIISLIWYLYFLKTNHLNSILSTLIIFSFFMFATNYEHYGLEIDIYRYLHRSIGILIAISLIFYVLKNKINVFVEKPILILILFFTTLIISYIDNDIFINYYFHYVRNFIFIALIVSYLYFKVDTNLKIEELFKLILGLTVILSLMVIYELGTIGADFSWNVRASLFYSNPNYLAYALMLGFVFSVFSDYKYKWLILLLIIFSIFATGSRSVELAVIFILISFLFYKNLNKTYLILFFFSISALIYLSLFSSLPFVSEIIKKNTIDQVRTSTLNISINMIETKPINGIGYGQFRIKFSDYIDEDFLIHDKALFQIIRTYDHKISDDMLKREGSYRNMELMTHNDLLTVIAELGIIGIAFIVYVFYKLYYELKRLLLYNRKYFYISLSLIISSLTFSMFHNILSSFVFWFIIFIPFIINRNYRKLLKT
jgi:O-antigen ligase